MRGYQKRVVYLKNIGSSMFDEAYFVLKSDFSNLDNEKKSFSLVREANRIIEENTDFHRREKHVLNVREILVYLFGFISAALIFLLLILI